MDVKRQSTRSAIKEAGLSTDIAYEMLRTTVARRVKDPSKEGNGFRLAQPGDQGAKNYEFLSSADDLDEFGIGIGIYFRSLKAFACIFIIGGLFNILAFRENADYNPDDTPSQLEGSVYGAVRESLKFDAQVTADILITLSFLAFTIYMTLTEDNQIAEIDESQQTTQDYSVWIRNPLPTVYDTDTYKRFFEKFGEVVSVTVAKKNGDLIDALAERKALREKIQYMEDAGITDDVLDNEFLRYISIMAGFTRGLKQMKERIENLTALIESKKNEDFEPWRVFVTFNHESDQSYCLDCLSGFKNRLNYAEELLMNGHKMIVDEAPEPNAVIYTSSHISDFNKYFSWIVSYGISTALVACAYFLLVVLVESAPDAVAIFVSILNSVLPTIMKMLTTSYEVHDTLDSQQASILIKLLVTRCLTATVLIYIATPFTEKFDKEKLSASQMVLILDCILGPVLRILDPFPNFLRYVLAPRICVTQDELNHFFEASQWTLAERYTDVMKTAVVGLFYAVTIPSGLFITAAAMIITYMSDKFSLYNVWAKPPLLDAKLAITARYFFGFAIWIHTSISMQFFANWPYASTDQEADCNVFICSKDSNMSSDQDQAMDTYATFNVAIFAIVMIWYFNHAIIVAYYFITNQEMPEEDEPDESKIAFRTVEGEHVYIPQVDRIELIDQVLCADVRHVPANRHPLKMINLVWDKALKKFVPHVNDTVEETADVEHQRTIGGKAIADPSTYLSVVKADEFNNTESGTKADSMFAHIFSNVKFYPPQPGFTAKIHGLHHKGGHLTDAFGAVRAAARLGSESNTPVPPPDSSFNGTTLSTSDSNVNPIAVPPPLPTPSNHKGGLEAVRAAARLSAHKGAPPLPPVAVSSDDLPEGWEVKTDPSGKAYYVNHKEKKTQWTPPIV